jgi:hypothetical protein
LADENWTFFLSIFKNQKTFAFSKSKFFSTGVGKKKCPIFQGFKEIPFKM